LKAPITQQEDTSGSFGTLDLFKMATWKLQQEQVGKLSNFLETKYITLGPFQHFGLGVQPIFQLLVNVRMFKDWTCISNGLTHKVG
jgi:hypothetical protein